MLYLPRSKQCAPKGVLVEKESISIFIFNHGRFGEELIKSTELITGKIEDIQAFSLLPGMSIEDFCNVVKEPIMSSLNKKLILCDLFGGTPCNVAMMMSLQVEVDIVCGVNLPMLIDVVLSRESGKSINEIVESAVKTGQESVSIPEKIKKGVMR